MYKKVWDLKKRNHKSMEGDGYNEELAVYGGILWDDE